MRWHSDITFSTLVYYDGHLANAMINKLKQLVSILHRLNLYFKFNLTSFEIKTNNKIVMKFIFVMYKLKKSAATDQQRSHFIYFSHPISLHHIGGFQKTSSVHTLSITQLYLLKLDTTIDKLVQSIKAEGIISQFSTRNADNTVHIADSGDWRPMKYYIILLYFLYLK